VSIFPLQLFPAHDLSASSHTGRNSVSFHLSVLEDTGAFEGGSGGSAIWRSTRVDISLFFGNFPQRSPVERAERIAVDVVRVDMPVQLDRIKYQLTSLAR